MTETMNHEGRISRLEGVVEQINVRLSTIEKVGFTLLSVILAGMVAVIVKLWTI